MLKSHQLVGFNPMSDIEGDYFLFGEGSTNIWGGDGSVKPLNFVHAGRPEGSFTFDPVLDSGRFKNASTFMVPIVFLATLMQSMAGYNKSQVPSQFDIAQGVLTRAILYIS